MGFTGVIRSYLFLGNLSPFPGGKGRPKWWWKVRESPPKWPGWRPKCGGRNIQVKHYRFLGRIKECKCRVILRDFPVFPDNNSALFGLVSYNGLCYRGFLHTDCISYSLCMEYLPTTLVWVLDAMLFTVLEKKATCWWSPRSFGAWNFWRYLSSFKKSKKSTLNSCFWFPE